MKNKGEMLLPILLLIALSHMPLIAQQRIKRGVLVSSAGRAAVNENQIKLTFGQPVVGAMGGVEHKIHSGFWFPLDVSTGVEPVSSVVPGDFQLLQNYPNPFNPTTIITFRVAAGCRVRVTLYDVLGRQAAVLADGHFNAGEYNITLNAAGLASGLYFYRMVTPAYTALKKAMLMK